MHTADTAMHISHDKPRYQEHGPLRGTNAPVVGVLLYRKHVVTEQPYLLQLILQLEQVCKHAAGCSVQSSDALCVS
jgi:hypothetical protein